MIMLPSKLSLPQKIQMQRPKPIASLNVLGEPLVPCSLEPMTGFFRDGCCNTCKEDVGVHTVCVEVSAAFLEFSKAQGNDLLTPHTEWCLCAGRWLQAHQQDAAPPVFLSSTHARTLEIVPLNVLKENAAIIN